MWYNISDRNYYFKWKVSNNDIWLVFKTILIPYDGSNMSNKALDHTVEIARLIKDSKIIIIHVIPEIPPPIFLKEVRSPKTGVVITFSEYMYLYIKK